MSGAPGTLVHISGDDVPAYFGMRTSPYEAALPDLLAAAVLHQWGIAVVPHTNAAKVVSNPGRLLPKLEACDA